MLDWLPNWVMPLLVFIGIVALLYRAFLHTPRASTSGKNHEEGFTNYWFCDRDR